MKNINKHDDAEDQIMTMKNRVMTMDRTDKEHEK